MTPTLLLVRPPLWAISKPAGMRIHPANNDGVADLCTWIAAQRDLPRGLVPAHRLDVQTSGVVLCAATPAARAEVGGWLSEGRLQKTYLALVHGKTRKKGIINRALADQRRGHPLEAITRYRVEAWLGGFTLLQVQLLTGRRHQIRRHLHSIGHPLVGDDRYRPRRFRAVPGFPGRIWLHAWRLVLPDGTRIEAPLPPDLAHCIDALAGPEEE